MKQCSKCNQRLEESNFYKDISKKDGLKSHCIACVKKYRQTDHCKAIQAIAEKKYRQTEKGKLTRKLCQERYEKGTRGKRMLQKKQIRMIDRYPKKYLARKEVRKAIYRGDIRKRNACEICYDSPTDCHHEDYSKPLEFIELCRKCHNVLHKQYKEQNILIT